MEWLANSRPPWAEYWSLVAGRLIALDKQSNIQLVGIGKTWRCCFANFILAVAVPEDNEACGMDNLCEGLEVGIKGGIHVMRLLFQQHSQEEDWGFLLIDARKALNE